MCCRRSFLCAEPQLWCGVTPRALTIAVHVLVVAIKHYWRFAATMAAVVRLLSTLSFLLYCFPGTSCSRQDVLELGDADFDYLTTEHETMLVKFYAPW